MAERNWTDNMLISVLEIAPYSEVPKKVSLGIFYSIVVHHHRVVTVAHSDKLLDKVFRRN